MDNRAHKILSSVIESHGDQLLTSNAFCKVYLTGHLADFAQERRLLIFLKEQELPRAFLDFKESRISEAELHRFIDDISNNATYAADSLAWGVDAWASAVNLPGSVHLNMLKQCFSGFRSVSIPEAVISSGSPQHLPVSNVSTARGAIATACLAAVVGLLAPQALDSHLSPAVKDAQVAPPLLQHTAEIIKPVAKPEPLVNSKPVVKHQAFTTRISAAEMLDKTLASSKVSKDESPIKPVAIAIGSPDTRALKTKQLRADIDAYLQANFHGIKTQSQSDSLR